MDEKEIEAIFARHSKIKFTIIESSKHERRQIKTVLREAKITNIQECEDYAEAWEKLRLTSTNVLVFTIDDIDGEDFLNKIIESTRFKKTPLIIFTNKIHETPKLFAQEEIIAEWKETPINALKVEKTLLRTMINGVMEKSLVGAENIALNHYTAGIAALNKGDFAAAKDEFRKALKENPSFVEAYHKMVETLMGLKEYDTAKKVLDRAMTYSEDNPAGLLLKCELAVEMEDKDQALKVLDYAAEKRKGDLKFIIDIGNIALEKGWIDEAVKYFEMAKNIDPNLLHVYNRLGIAHCRAGRFEKAVEMYEGALTIDEKDAGIHFNIAMAYHRKGQGDKALEYFRLAEKLDPDMPEPKEWIEKISAQQ